MKNAIVTAADSRYLPAACCALLSCVGDGEAGAQASLFLIACDVSAQDAEDARSFLGSRGAEAEIIRINPNRFDKFRIDGYVSASTYTRLLLPEFFDDCWDRVLYVDSDMRVMTSLKGLLEVNLGGKPVGAVHDYMRYLIYGLEHSREQLGLRPDSPYFNAGMICFDWHAVLASGLLQTASEFAAKHPQLCISHDQDALNKAFEGSWTPLDPRWNFMIVAVPDRVLRLDYPERLRPYVAHFAGPVKPWTADFPARYENHRAWYRDLLRDSPWPNFTASVSASSSQIGLKGWASKQRERLRTAVDRLSAGTTSRQPNPKLERLVDDMIGEASGSATAEAIKRIASL
jgi:lipopolysaccharide biosynthesis glycosyltransferase